MQTQLRHLYLTMLQEERVEINLAKPIGPVLSALKHAGEISRAEYAIAQLLLLNTSLKELSADVVPLIQNTLNNFSHLQGKIPERCQRLWVNFQAARLIGNGDLAREVMKRAQSSCYASTTYLEMLSEFGDPADIYEYANQLLVHVDKWDPTSSATQENYRLRVMALSKVRSPELLTKARETLFEIANEVTSPKMKSNIRSAPIRESTALHLQFYYDQIALQALIGMGQGNLEHDLTENKIEPRILQKVQQIGMALVLNGKNGEVARFEWYIKALESFKKPKHALEVAQRLKNLEPLWQRSGHFSKVKIWLYDLYKTGGHPQLAREQLEQLIYLSQWEPTESKLALPFIIDQSVVEPLILRTIESGDTALVEDLRERLQAALKTNEVAVLDSQWKVTPTPNMTSEFPVPDHIFLPAGVRLALRRIIEERSGRSMDVVRMARDQDVSALIEHGTKRLQQYKGVEHERNSRQVRGEHQQQHWELKEAEDAFLAAVRIQVSETPNFFSNGSR